MAKKSAPKLGLIIGGAKPAGPIAGGLPKGAGQSDRKGRERTGLPLPKRDHRSKKHYAGTVAGLGRPAVPVHPRGFAGTTFKTVQGSKPSLMTRIGRRIGSFFGIKRSRPTPK